MENYARDLMERRLEKVNKDLEHEEDNNMSIQKQKIESDNRISQLRAEQKDLINGIARLPG